MVGRPPLKELAAREQVHRGQDQSAAQEGDGLEYLTEEGCSQQDRNNRLEGGKHRSVRRTDELEPCKKGDNRDNRGDECYPGNGQPAGACQRPMRAVNGSQQAVDNTCGCDDKEDCFQHGVHLHTGEILVSLFAVCFDDSGNTLFTKQLGLAVFEERQGGADLFNLGRIHVGNDKDLFVRSVGKDLAEGINDG